MTVNAELQRRAARLVSQEVNTCMSSLVATLARVGAAEDRDMNALCEQAVELAAPVLDYESAVREEAAAGRVYKIVPSEEELGSFEWRLFENGEETDREGFFPTENEALVAAMAFRDDIPELEVYEHWAVSSWLAEKLIAKGERVDTDFAGMNVWARTTTGQVISADSVIEAITTETGYAGG